jgi:peptidoglycan-N-acetylglucosamine deacetylase
LIRSIAVIATLSFLVGVLLLSAWKQFYRRELDPWLEPNRTLWSWRWDGMMRAPTALYDEWVHGDSDQRRRKLIALTFDDGPYPLYTPLLLDILKRYGVKATFFLVGIHVREYPALARQIVLDGHEIANHTHRHRRERDLTQAELTEEILSCERALEEVTGKRPRLFRPAGGFLSDSGVRNVQQLGYTMCNATINPGDWWQRDPDLLIRFCYRGRSREGVTLMHSGALGIVKAMPGYINALRAKGFEFVTVSELTRELGRPLPELPLRSAAQKSLEQDPDSQVPGSGVPPLDSRREAESPREQPAPLEAPEPQPLDAPPPGNPLQESNAAL